MSSDNACGPIQGLHTAMIICNMQELLSLVIYEDPRCGAGSDEPFSQSNSRGTFIVPISVFSKLRASTLYEALIVRTHREYIWKIISRMTISRPIGITMSKEILGPERVTHLDLAAENRCIVMDRTTGMN